MRRFSRLLPVAAAGILAACEGPVPTTIQPNTSAVSLDAVGATAQLSAQVLDQDGNPLDSTPRWTSDNTSVATVNATGQVTAVANGTAIVTVSSGPVSAQVSVTVSQVRTSMAKVSGDGQTGEVGAALPQAIEVEVRDRLNVGIPDASVAFAVTQGGGSVASASATTDASGRASTMWTLGTNAAATQSVSASSGPVSALFAASAVAGAPDTLSKQAGDNQARVAGQPVRDSLVVRVVDRFGNPVQGGDVAFVVTSGGGSASPDTAATDATGLAATEWTLGMTVGSQTLEARINGLTVQFTANGTANLSDSVAVFEGANQTGLVDFAVNIAPAVQVFDPAGDPFAGATVAFEVTAGGGATTGDTVITGTNGVARVGSWTLGATPGANQVTATVLGAGIAGNPVVFDATGILSQFDVVVQFHSGTTPTAGQQAAFDSAEAFWERLLISEHADRTVNIAANTCFGGQLPHPAVNQAVDDVLILVQFTSLDGPSGTLARAGPCLVRASGGGADTIPYFGLMEFDTADLPGLESSGQLDDVVLHEMGHVLGVGSLWDIKGFLQNPSLPSSPGVDTYFDGPRAIDAFNGLGGTSYTGGAKVPVENSAVSGSADSHWRESVFDEELMTPIIENSGPNPLSRLTVASLWDLGYMVNLAGAESYTQIFTAPAMAAGGGIRLVNDVILGPVYDLDARGRLIRLVPRPR